MNRHSVALLMTICVVSLLSSSLSHAAVFGDFEYRDNGTTITITRYNGTGGEIIIPETIDGKPVREIGSEAFYEKVETPSTLALPSTLTTIGWEAFRGCSGFTGSLTIPEGVTIIGFNAFRDCMGFTGSLVIPEGVTTIGDDIFNNCAGFDGTLTLPSTLRRIGKFAFSDCSGFTGSLVIPEGVTTIVGGAFRGCSGFSGLTLPSTLTTIENCAFAECSGFTGSLVIPEGVISVGEIAPYVGAFSDCSGFTGLTLPSTLTTIGLEAFRGCSGISKAVFLGNAPTDMAWDFFKDTAEGFFVVCGPESTGFTFPEWQGYPCKRETVEGAGM